MTEYVVMFFGADYKKGDPQYEERDVNGEMISPAPCLIETTIVASSLWEAVLFMSGHVSFPVDAVSVSVSRGGHEIS